MKTRFIWSSQDHVRAQEYVQEASIGVLPQTGMNIRVKLPIELETKVSVSQMMLTVRADVQEVCIDYTKHEVVVYLDKLTVEERS